MNARFLPIIDGLINEDPIFVVSVIGNNRALNLETIERLINLQPFKEQPKICIENEGGNEGAKLLANKQSYVEHYYDRETSLLVLHLCTVHEVDQLGYICSLDQILNLTPSEFHVWLEKQESHYWKLLFFIFLVSHHIMIVDRGNTFDLQYLKMLRIMQTLRGHVASSNMMTLIADAIHASDIKYISPCVPGRWIPMLNFIFYINNRKINKETLESSLESQIRFLLKKSRVHYTVEPGSNITSVNMSYIPLFGIDPSKCVYVCSNNSSQLNPIQMLLLQDSITSTSTTLTKDDSISKLSEYILKIVRYLLGNKEQRRQIISFKAWKVSCGVVEEYLYAIQQRKGGNKNYNEGIDLTERIKPYLDSSYKYSANRCQQCMTVARSHYLSNLPPLYTFHQHESQLSSALQLFTQLCRGPAVDLYIQRFKEECLKIWKNRQLCDAKSCTGNPCTIKTESAQTNHVHQNSIVYTHACSCGGSVFKRGDPFTLEDTYKFYADHNKCCSTTTEFNLSNTIIKNHNNNLIEFEYPIWEIFKLGNDTYYDPKVGVLQPGFIPGRNFLTLITSLPYTSLKTKSQELISNYEVSSSIGSGCNLGEQIAKLRKYKAMYRQDIAEHSLSVSNSSTSKSRNKSNSRRSRKKQPQPNTSVTQSTETTSSNNTYYIGYELECPNGHRYFMNKEDLPSSKV